MLKGKTKNVERQIGINFAYKLTTLGWIHLQHTRIAVAFLSLKKNSAYPANERSLYWFISKTNWFLFGFFPFSF